ncbi:MAG: tyrosine-protein phosphatase [Clostridiales bacterium]|nr:tyrosine-protein phosphatase [Clostridiales bacterium]
MKNNWKISIATALAAITSVTVCANIQGNAEAMDVVKFSSEITALTPYDGATVSVVHSGIESVLALTNPTQAEIAKYYYFRPEMQEFSKTGLLPDTEELLRCYNVCDDFAPVGNVLRWQYASKADNYTVNVALDKNFTQVVYSETVESTSVNLGNTLYSGTDYYWQVIANNGTAQVRSDIFEFTTKAGARTVDIDGVSNTRDVGGYATPNGKTMQGLIYRTARLDDVTETGKATAMELGIKTDLDLRAVGEGKPNPLEINYVNATPAPLYANGINTAESKAAIKTIFSTFANKDNYPIVMHCSVGRDRTGTAVALLNGLLGVEEQTIVNEYLLSAFAYISSWEKHQDALLGNINNLLTYVKTFEGETLAEKTENLLLDAGVTAEEIQSVRDIMLGKTKVMDNTVDCDVNYNGMHFVTVKSYGRAKETYAVKDGVVLTAPYALAEDEYWIVNGAEYDFTTPVTQDLTIGTAKKEYIKITVSASGTETIVKAVAGEAVDFVQFAKDGYTYKVMNAKGDIITSLTATEDCAISVLYIKN